MSHFRTLQRACQSSLVAALGLGFGLALTGCESNPSPTNFNQPVDTSQAAKSSDAAGQGAPAASPGESSGGAPGKS